MGFFFGLHMTYTFWKCGSLNLTDLVSRCSPDAVNRTHLKHMYFWSPITIGECQVSSWDYYYSHSLA